MRHFIGKLALVLHGLVVAVEQGVDGVRDRTEFLPIMASGQALALLGLQRFHVLG
ncbi:hypothetical protein D3C72_2010550 [compost metagenome]